VTSRERVLAACAFNRPDRVPCFDHFWKYPQSWRERFGPEELLTDIEIWVPDETTFPTRVRRLKEEDGWITEVNGWGATVRSRSDTYFTQTLAAAIPEGATLDSVRFDDPALDVRYCRSGKSREETLVELERAKRQHCVFGKTGGPYLRTTFVRGEEQFLVDMGRDPAFAAELAALVAQHLIAVGLQELRRWDLADTGIWIYDDMAGNRGPMFSPVTFERVLLPSFRAMVSAFKKAGACHVFLHSDGDIKPILDMIVDAGIDGLNPLERRAGMAIEEIRKRYPRLVLVGGMCNTDTLVNGPIGKIRDEARRILDMGREGGVVIGTHSLSPEIPMEHFAIYRQTCETYGR
jgi:hypothetical protein